MYLFETESNRYEVRAIEPGVFRVMMSDGGKFRESLLSRYHILEEKGDLAGQVKESKTKFSLTVGHATITIDKKKNIVTVTGTKSLMTVAMKGAGGGAYQNNGFRLELPLSEGERLYGIGDESRESIARRGRIAELNTVNIRAYGPIPYLVSTNGYAILVNCTYPQTFDLGCTNPDLAILDSPKGGIDFYVFVPESGSILDNVQLCTDVTGKPVMMPKSFYGMTFVMNEMTDVRAMLYDCREFRREDIPCDMVGLEPQWMSKMYDFTTEKKWDRERFRVNDWMPENTSDSQTFYNALKNMGFKMSLWLCMNYDLLWEEERRVGGELPDPNVTYSFEGAKIIDTHFSNAVYIDEITKRDEPWFAHLEKFVDNGAAAFKLDACTQVLHHADRLWGGKYTDDEVHNVYPVLYARQMKEGFEAHTKGRRALIYTPCVFAGTQKYAASWAGDTGGGFDTVISMLNFAFCGHTNVSCDIEPTPQGLHYGYFLPWSQYMGWNNWLQPWFLTPEMEEMVRYYGKLRSALFPYIYSAAHKAARTGIPMVRALSMDYPDCAAYDDVKNMYLFGDSFLVGVFDMEVTLPKGTWIDYFTGDVYEGLQTFSYDVPKGRGGALFVKAGSVFAMMDPQPWVEKVQPDHYHIKIYAGGDCAFDLVDDDGLTYDYLSGKMAHTHIRVENSTSHSLSFVLEMREGTYDGRIQDETAQNSDPDIHGIGPVEGFDVCLVTNEIKSVTLDGEAVPIHDNSFVVPAKLHQERELHYLVRF